MSVLEVPRLSFSGRITWDPIVTNNSAHFYDEQACETTLRPGETAQDFRQSAIAAVGNGGGNWNPHGTHRSIFFDTTVSSVSLPGAHPSTTEDRMVGQPVAFEGMLVDSEPYGAFSSQLFFDTLQFGIDGGARILAPRSTRMTARRINFKRNLGYGYIAGGASVMWQTAFDKEGLLVQPHDSAVLAAFEQALADDDVLGLTVRWNAYRTIYYANEAMSDSTVAKAEYARLTGQLEAGGFQPNPAVSHVVGVLGLWRRGEPAAVGGDRFLVSTGATPIASAYARIGDGRVTLDLQNSIPEDGLDLKKHDYGPLELVAVDPGSRETTSLGTLEPSAYSREIYVRDGGLVELPLPKAVDAAALETCDLHLRNAGNTDLLVELPRYACPESPNTYLTEGESRATRVRVLERGKPAAGQSVHLVDVNDSGKRTSFETDAEGVAEVQVRGADGGGVTSFYLLVGDQPTPSQLNPINDPYCYVRALPKDDQIAALPPTWENVYQNVLINWHAMAPCMDNWLDLGDEAQMRRYALILRKLTDPEAIEHYRFMPVTRDMTPGARTLLWKWIDGAEASAETESWTLAREQRNLRQRMK